LDSKPIAICINLFFCKRVKCFNRYKEMPELTLYNIFSEFQLGNGNPGLADFV